MAVTGLAGHAYGSWKSREGTFMWLQDSLPFELGHSVRVMIYGYNTTLTETTRRVDVLDELAESFVGRLISSRSQVSGCGVP